MSLIEMLISACILISIICLNLRINYLRNLVLSQQLVIESMAKYVCVRELKPTNL